MLVRKPNCTGMHFLERAGSDTPWRTSFWRWVLCTWTPARRPALGGFCMKIVLVSVASAALAPRGRRLRVELECDGLAPNRTPRQRASTTLRTSRTARSAAAMPRVSRAGTNGSSSASDLNSLPAADRAVGIHPNKAKKASGSVPRRHLLVKLLAVLPAAPPVGTGEAGAAPAPPADRS
jgi:hypothetical protein